MANKFRLKEKSQAVDLAIREMVYIAAKDAVIFFRKSFNDEGFTDNNVEMWKPRKGQIKSLGGFTSQRTALGKKTLFKTGILKNSIKFKRNLERYSAIIYSDLPYSAIHNEGLSGMAWGKHPFTMPKRKFIGNSNLLEKRTVAKCNAKIKTDFLNA